ncbi:MAG: patatin-like phospholipase family protein [Hyphomicrobiales bacterium]
MAARAGRLPPIGLALGAGAARGWAHIGVLERLTELGVVPAVIAGSSVGALAGGLYAAGRLGALKEFALSITRRRMFSLLDLSWQGSGFIAGERLRELLDAQIGDRSFADLAIPFLSIATDYATGHELWLREGRLVPAIRASYALPGIFRPIEIGGQWLIDGGVVNPIPVTACRALGARIVIAVTLGPDSASGTVIQNPQSESETSHDAPALKAVLVAAFNITQDRLSRSRLAGDPPDLLVQPRTPEIGIFDFDKASEAIAAGREAVDRVLTDFERLLRQM